jgi:hypothetical protein
MIRTNERRRAGRDFPYLGSEAGGVSDATRTRYFVTAPFARLELGNGKPATADGGPLHAKQMGTSFTVCGLEAGTWPKFWDVPFHSIVGSVCKECAASVT